MIKKVIETYEALNTELVNDMTVNDPKTRKLIKDRLELDLPHCKIKCDETLNSVNIIEACVAVARVEWINKAMEISYVDLVFGNSEQIIVVQSEINKM